MKLMPMAWLRTSTSRGPGCGTGTSASWSTSGPPVFSKRTASIGSAQVLAGEGVVAAGIAVEAHRRMVLQGGDDQRLRLLRHIGVLFGDMQHQRVGEPLRFAEIAL